ncbi:uncharacterized protein B0H64DRAFT_210947 [Chaetomium fimeti]|uniref:Uncharacterized protein n=1 Tax=Chaetomium fimeti TaxID=1854472 RepID=A0AAE0LQ53_9PEZI|nr:hypothetical protein B0H64DRAFT_210947 [Chaetomium fimeti]
MPLRSRGPCSGLLCSPSVAEMLRQKPEPKPIVTLELQRSLLGGAAGISVTGQRSPANGPRRLTKTSTPHLSEPPTSRTNRIAGAAGALFDHILPHRAGVRQPCPHHFSRAGLVLTQVPPVAPPMATTNPGPGRRPASLAAHPCSRSGLSSQDASPLAPSSRRAGTRLEIPLLARQKSRSFTNLIRNPRPSALSNTPILSLQQLAAQSSQVATPGSSS